MTYPAVYGPVYGSSWPYGAVIAAAVEMNLGGTWTDTTQYVLQRDGSGPPIHIQRGRPDETSTANPSSANYQLNNQDGRFTPKNPLGPYYGSLQRNTPMRVSVPGAENYLRMEDDNQSLASTGSTPRFISTTDQDIRMDMKLTNYQPCVLASWWASGGERAWAFLLNGDGTLSFYLSPDGTFGNAVVATSTMPVPYGRGCLRVTYGEGTGVITFWTAPTGSMMSHPAYTQLGQQISGVVTGPCFNSAAILRFGYNSVVGGTDIPAYNAGPNGEFYDFVVFNGLNGLSGGTGQVVARGAFSTLAAGTTSWQDTSLGTNTWTLQRTANISGRSFRFHGEMSSFPTAWDPSGTDVWTEQNSGGPLRRIQAGNTPVLSSIRRYGQSLINNPGNNMVFYWPLEDGVLSGQLSSAMPNGLPMRIVSGTPNLASDTTFICSGALPKLNGAATFGRVVPYSDTGTLVVRFLFNPDTALPVQLSYILRIHTSGTLGAIDIYFEPGSGYQASWTPLGGGTGGLLSAFVNVAGPVELSLELTTSGGNISPVLRAMNTAGQISTASTVPAIAGSIGAAYSCAINSFADNPAIYSPILNSVIGHIYGQTTLIPLQNNPANVIQAWAGEAAGSRIARLCADNNIQARIYGYPFTTAAMGPQSTSTLLQLLQECESADMGIIYEPRDSLSIGYRTLNSMCSQSAKITFDYSQAHLGQRGEDGELTPTYDDQQTRNDITASRNNTQSALLTVGGKSLNVTGQLASGGSYEGTLNDGSAMSISPPPVGVGDYNTSIGVNVNTDQQLFDIVGWRLNVQTVDEERYPILPLNLARPELLPMMPQILPLEIGDYWQLINTPVWVAPPPVRQLIFGVQELVGGFWFLIDWNSVPESPFEVMVLDDAVLGHFDTDGSQLHAGVTATATALPVDTINANSPTWTTSASDLPFDIIVGGERITVTAISAPGLWLIGQDTNFEGGLGGWAPVSGCTITDSNAQANSGSFSMAVTATGTSDAIARAATGASRLPCNPGDSITVTGFSRAATIPRSTKLRVYWQDANFVDLSNVPGPTATDATTGWTALSGSALTAPAGAAYACVGAHVVTPGGAGEVHYFDDIQMTNQNNSQHFTCTRSVNGISKPHVAAESVKLFYGVVLGVM